MRIVSGKWRGRTLTTPEGLNTRPTTDRVREALFSMLEARGVIADAAVLDLFAGSGALSLEALSRGARFALLVETDAEARGAIRNNVESLGATGITRVFKRDATRLGAMPNDKGGPFSLVFLDPPYGKGLGEAALKSVLEGGWLAPEALVVLECSAQESPRPEGFHLEDMRIYGDTKIVLLTANGAERG